MEKILSDHIIKLGSSLSIINLNNLNRLKGIVDNRIHKIDHLKEI